MDQMTQDTSIPEEIDLLSEEYDDEYDDVIAQESAESPQAAPPHELPASDETEETIDGDYSFDESMSLDYVNPIYDIERVKREFRRENKPDVKGSLKALANDSTAEKLHKDTMSIDREKRRPPVPKLHKDAMNIDREKCQMSLPKGRLQFSAYSGNRPCKTALPGIKTSESSMKQTMELTMNRSSMHLTLERDDDWNEPEKNSGEMSMDRFDYHKRKDSML